MKYYSLITEWVKRRTFLVLYLLPMMLGVVFASLTVNKYPIFVRASLGFAVIFLLALIIKLPSSLRDENTVKYMPPSDLKTFRDIFLIAVVVSWAIIQIFIFIFYLFNNL